jgi:protocadherin Fat 1/2/3
VIDVNENRYAPQFEDFVLVGSLKENQSPGASVMRVMAKDFDIQGPDSRISYSTIRGDGLGLFAIDNEGSFKNSITNII